MLADCDEWRSDAWNIIRERKDCRFLFVTKRILRFADCVPPDWGDGWDNVTVVCTCENQKRADERLPVFLNAPVKHRQITCEPLLEYVDLSKYLCPKIESVSVGGESGAGARVCDYEWVKKMRDDCVKANVPFCFRQTGANFKKDGKIYRVPRPEQGRQAQKADIDFDGKK